jgi:hypothetical protein
MITKITKRSLFPKYVQQFKKLKGICIGGCVDQDLDQEHVAHAHVYGKYKGWICFKYKYHFRKLVILHEVAHILVGWQEVPHGRKWRNALTKIGGTFKAYSYAIKRGNRKGRIYFPDYTYRPRKL